jgi:hypothetical protein
MFPNLVNYDPAIESKPECAGEFLGTLPYHFPDRVAEVEFFADKNGCLKSAQAEFNILSGNSTKASFNESKQRFNKSMEA